MFSCLHNNSPMKEQNITSGKQSLPNKTVYFYGYFEQEHKMFMLQTSILLRGYTK